MWGTTSKAFEKSITTASICLPACKLLTSSSTNRTSGDLVVDLVVIILLWPDSRRRHKDYKSCGERQIFRRCLLFGIARSSSDFLDLEPGRKGQAADVCRPPLGDCSATARFAQQVTKFSADVLTAIGRRPSGDRWATCRSPSDNNKSYDDRQVIGRSPFGHRVAIYRFAMDGILKWTFNFCMFIVIVNMLLISIVNNQAMAFCLHCEVGCLCGAVTWRRTGV